MFDRLDITDQYSVNCDFILNTIIFIEAALNISWRKFWKYHFLSFYLFGQEFPNETEGTINLSSVFSVFVNKGHKERVCPPTLFKNVYIFWISMKSIFESFPGV